MLKNALCFLFCVILIGGCNAPKIELSIAQVFSNHMVLQQDQLNAIWGTATPNTEITLTSSWGEKVFSKVDALGNWMLYLPTPPFDKNAPLDGFTIDVTDGISEIKISDVLIGEVWLASGQSNMVWSMNQCDGCVINQAKEIRNSDNSFIRMFTVPPDLTNESLKHTKWLSASQKNTGDFSAVAYYFAKKLYDEIKVPIEIVNPNKLWDEIEFPWMDLAMVELQSYCDYKDGQSYIFSIGQHPKSLGLLEAKNIHDYNSICIMRSKSMMAKKARLLAYKLFSIPDSISNKRDKKTLYKDIKPYADRM